MRSKKTISDDMGMKKMEWLLHSKTQSHKKKVSYSVRIIKEALSNQQRFGIQWSGGKDSTAMTHLINGIDSDIPIITQFDTADWPEKKPYVERLSKKMGWDVIGVEPEFNVMERMRAKNPCHENVCAQSHSITIESFIEPLERKFKEMGIVGRFWGLRNQESIGRRMNYRKRGALYKTKSGRVVCTPIHAWLVEDVFAYLTAHGVEINPCYLKNKFRHPEDIRLAWAVPTNSVDMLADVEHIRYYYPEHFRMLRKIGII
jgi:3'-phosphoadenosine 5'-phosphosulfate sulfotransferase (PAPS reductase)/FAD synthetase